MSFGKMANIDEVQEMYTQRASLYHNLFIDFLSYGRSLEAFFRKSNYLRSDLKILDAGCGSGILLRILYKLALEKKLRGITLHGFDLNKTMLNLFKQWMLEKDVRNIKLKQANVLKLETLPKDWKKYDLIVSSAMLEHLEKNKIKNALLQLKGRLKNNGILLVFITKNNLLLRFFSFFWKGEWYGQKEIKQILEEVGFKRIRFKKFDHLLINLWGHIIEAKK